MDLIIENDEWNIIYDEWNIPMTPIKDDFDKPYLPSTREMFLHLAFWFGHSCYWFIVSIVLVPSHIQSIVGDERKGSGLSVIQLLAGAVVLFLSPVIGKPHYFLRVRFHQ
jgi:hypothetical protein